ncbi:MAG: hypothetical protein MUE82_07480 [Chloroflexi bacterium]|nr:hypothetical protein [Chloroflexota bacterium]
MRVRTLQLRLLATVVAVLWAVTAALVLVGYRPGGPLDLVVGIAAAAPLLVAIAAVAWPPAVRGSGAYAGVVWVGLGAVLILIPSVAGIVSRLAAGGTQTLLPSPESAYPWLLALGATATLAGIGIVRRALGPGAPRRTRLGVATAVSVALLVVSGLAFGAAAVGNELALAGRPTAGSRFGPTGPGTPPACSAAISVGETARLTLRLDADADGRTTGTVDLAGARDGTDLRWSAAVAGDLAFGAHGAARIGGEAWVREPGTAWQVADPVALDDATVDARAVAVALPATVRAAAEDRGLEFVEGALARHCRVAVDGTTFVAAFPQARWLIPAGTPIERWRGEVDYWVFLDGQVGLIEAFASGTAADLRPGALLGTLRARMTATDRGAPVTLVPPG